MARARATELGIDPATLAGTGPDGAITLQDVERANPPVASADRHARMRQAIAAAMARSKREIPHFYLASTIDLEPALGWLEAENAQRPVTERLLAGVLFLKAVALALREVPELNARWEASRVAPNAAVHLGMAIALRGGGLVAPALHDADRLGLAELMRAFRDLVQRARAGTLRSSELSDPTITVTSLGEQGAETVFPRDLPAAGGDRRVRPDRAAAVGGRRRARRAPRGQGDARRGPPRDRWPSRRTLSRRARTVAPGACTSVTRDDIRATVLRVLGDIAPEADLAALRPDRELRDELDLDSMDILNAVIALHRALGIDIPEADYGRLATLDGAVEYLAGRAGV